MLGNQFLLPVHHELVVDLFAGNSVCPPLARAIVAANYAEQHAARLLREAAE